MNFWSRSSSTARTASTAYAPKATHNRIHPHNRNILTTAKLWCTGEDSNLRSSQGAADLQSAAINHSATCARFDRASRSQHVPESPNAGPESLVPAVKEHRALKRIALQSRQNSTTATRPYFRARFAIQEAAAGISSSLGELRVSFGLLLLRLAARSRSRFWSWRRDLNPRPSDYKSDALPAELRQPAAGSTRRADPSMILPASRDKH